MRKPRILYAVTDPMSALLVRGQLGYLREAGADVYFLSSPGDLAEDIAREDGVNYVPVPMVRTIDLGADLRSMHAMWRAIRAVEPDIVNFSTPKAGLLAGVASWAARTPVRVHTLHGLRMETMTGPLRWLLSGLQRMTSAVSHRVVCVSPSVRDAAIAHRVIEPHKALILGPGTCNGVDTARFSRRDEVIRAAADLRAELGISHQERVVGFVGRLARDKGIVELERAWRTVRARHDAHMVLVGGGELGDPVPTETMWRLRDDPRVHLVGLQRDLPPWYALMDVLVLPTYREGFGTVLLEASAMEVPVVATRTTGVVDAVADGETGTLVPVADSNTLASAIDRYLVDRAFAELHGAVGRRRVVAEFESRVVWARWLEFYRGLLRDAAADALGISWWSGADIRGPS
jgi:glycosyltransferase involved in cell wall biosynthesis